MASEAVGDVVRDRGVEEPGLLGTEREAAAMPEGLPGAQAVRVDAEDTYAPRHALGETRDDMKERGLPRAVPTHDEVHAPTRDLELLDLQGGLRAMTEREPFELDDRELAA
jgi:hypothetical protein